MDNQYLKNIKSGIRVQIITSQHKLSTGIVEEIAARNQFHKDGIMVRLKNGDVGRVQKILLTEQQQNDLDAHELKKILEKGETFNTEFKSEALWSTTYNPQQLKEAKSFEIREYGTRASKVIIAKSLAAFLNSEGGNLIIGVKEKKDEETFEIVGVSEDLEKLRSKTKDDYRRIIIDEIIRTFLPPKIFNHLNEYIEMKFVDIEDKTLLWIKIKPS
ncbi:MAG: putative DNA binding domain-containing protein, partial [Nanoarchaeota archaeon]|nr:putative DNA binding domain-containing protein [Nanoarchaeota archaeon]